MVKFYKFWKETAYMIKFYALSIYLFCLFLGGFIAGRSFSSGHGRGKNALNIKGGTLTIKFLNFSDFSLTL